MQVWKLNRARATNDRKVFYAMKIIYLLFLLKWNIFAFSGPASFPSGMISGISTHNTASTASMSSKMEIEVEG